MTFIKVEVDAQTSLIDDFTTIGRKRFFYSRFISGNSAYRRLVRTKKILLHIFHRLQSFLTTQAEYQSRLNLG